MDSKRLYVFRVSLIVALGGFLMGFDASVISGVVKFIEPHFNLTKLQLGWAVSCLTLTSTLGMVVAGPLSDKFGRKKLLTAAAIIYAVSAVLSATAPTYEMLIVARMLGGLGVGISLITAPMYIAELAPPEIRGTMVSFNQLNIVLGISIAFFTNYLILRSGNSEAAWVAALKIDENNWRWMLGLETLPAVIYFLALYLVPESPRWLMMKGKESEARAIIALTTTEKNAITVIDAIRSNTGTVKTSNKAKLKELFSPSLRLVLIIGIVIAVTQQITGINAVFFYAPMIFEQTGIGVDASFSQAILVGLTNLIFTIVAMWLIDRAGRKILLIAGLSGIIISMGLLSYGFGTATYKLEMEDALSIGKELNNSELEKIAGITFYSDLEFRDAVSIITGEEIFQNNKSVFTTAAIDINSWLVLIGLLGFVASFAVSLGPVMWVLFSELFPNRVRGVAISFAGFINSGVSFSVQLIFPWELANLGNTTTFIIYGIFGLAGLIILSAMLPETRGKSLEELELFLAGNKKTLSDE
ncbi:MAG: sugar porter family MFS transporter [Bacteroidales bacterium]